MSDDYQIEIPPSFSALYLDARQRLTVPLAELRSRYETCEDLANQLMEHGRHAHFDLGLPEREVLTRCLAGLQNEESGFSPSEATWVITRLAELLDWPAHTARTE